MFSPRGTAFRWPLFLFVLGALALSGCDDTQTNAIDTSPGFEDLTPPDVWDAGNNPNGCSYGYGEGCPTQTVDCELSPCGHGLCVSGGLGADTCLCDEGYAGLLCDGCAAGYETSGLICVTATGACATAPCVFGTCRPSGESFVCDCHAGYTGSLCAACAAGYHASNLQCVPD
ncbi:MAG: hypothetical protein CO108_02375 [Deltaproteobacteria bacterium CG_4_9_14_3_um_filter_63_12]|nr:MAG: hypothetical protein COW42_16810 [Deltaproteobacteria bacterium CG17_big_fil_post_rev_8_21_14_2_50_63_7]PJB48449.1 MAG: hypothetical protein CO108_02375 [Deltaproteobacteria bacterium CG_4_9_14_3_um_filter_63_12]